MSSCDSLQRARRLGNFRWQGWDPETHHAMTRLLHIIQPTPHYKLSDMTVLLPGYHWLVQTRIQVFLDVTMQCCMWHQCHSQCWETLNEQHSTTSQRIWILKKKNHYRNLKSHTAQINATDTIRGMPKIYRPLPSWYAGKHCKSYIKLVNVLRHTCEFTLWRLSAPIIRDM
jgi:hypothetical protein